jgi:hypothetical protein
MSNNTSLPVHVTSNNHRPHALRTSVFIALALLAVSGCASSDGSAPGAAGSGGTAGTGAAGSGGAAGSEGTAGTGNAGSGGAAGNEGTAGTSNAGSGGTAGNEGTAGASNAGSGGTAGNEGTAGTSNAGSGGTAGSGEAGEGGMAGGSGSPGTGDPCDPVAQDCPGPDLKCGGVLNNPNKADPACVKVTGAVQAGDPCVATMFGVDDCAKGLICSNRLTGVPTCRPLCAEDVNCAAGEKCALFGDAALLGICAKTCAPWGTECGMGSACDIFFAAKQGAYFMACRKSGEVPLGGACNSTTLCEANGQCRDSVCVPSCDYTHSCPTGSFCTSVIGLPNGFGWCS